MIKEYLKEQIEKLKENPGTAFGLLYPFVLVIILVIGFYYLSNEANVAQQNIPPAVGLKKAVVEDLTIQQPKKIPPIDVYTIAEPTPELIAIGKKIFTTTCAACHGEDGAGAGPGAVGLNPAPRNFTSNEGWINGQTLSGIFTTLTDGIPNSGMIAYDFLTPKERFALAHYIRKEFISNPPKDDEFDLMGLDALYNLSEEMDIPGQIPVKSAMKLIIDENSSKVQKAKNALNKIMKDRTARPVLLNKVTDDLNLAISALANSNKWKANKESLESFLTLNVNQNGFNGEIFNLSQSEWDLLYNYLNGLL